MPLRASIFASRFDLSSTGISLSNEFTLGESLSMIVISLTRAGDVNAGSRGSRTVNLRCDAAQLNRPVARCAVNHRPPRQRYMPDQFDGRGSLTRFLDASPFTRFAPLSRRARLDSTYLALPRDRSRSRGSITELRSRARLGLGVRQSSAFGILAPRSRS